jgi:hypothetical protein
MRMRVDVLRVRVRMRVVVLRVKVRVTVWSTEGEGVRY